MHSSPITTGEGYKKAEKFLHLDPVPEIVVVNVGYLLKRLTNGRWKNAVHRVSEPSSRYKNQNENSSIANDVQDEDTLGETIPERYSIAFFSAPDPSSTIEPLACCCSESTPKKWSPIIAGEYLQRKRDQIYS